jgi:hypothetical protein
MTDSHGFFVPVKSGILIAFGDLTEQQVYPVKFSLLNISTGVSSFFLLFSLHPVE